MSCVLPIDPRLLTPYEVRLLRIMPAFEHQALTKHQLHTLMEVASLHPATPFPTRFVQHGLVHRTRTGTGNAAPFRYWLTDLGAMTVHAIEAQGIDPNDTDGLLDPGNLKRGPITFRETMASFGLSNLRQLQELSVEDRRAFEREWTANMYAACARAGEPIPADPPPHPRH